MVGRYLLEPVGRNTAPALGLGALMVQPDDIIMMTTSDHVITKTDAFEQAVVSAVALARQDFIVTFGIEPTHPETGFGYIEHDGENVIQFREKPDLETAKAYLASGNFVWNSGMFCFGYQYILSELKPMHPRCMPAA